MTISPASCFRIPVTSLNPRFSPVYHVVLPCFHILPRLHHVFPRWKTAAQRRRWISSVTRCCWRSRPTIPPPSARRWWRSRRDSGEPFFSWVCHVHIIPMDLSYKHTYNPYVHLWSYERWWEFQDPKMEVRKRTIFLGIFSGDIPWNLGLKHRPDIW